MTGRRRIGEALPMSQRNKLEGMLGERLQERKTENRNNGMTGKEPTGMSGTDLRPHGLIDIQELKRYQDSLNLSANALLVITELLCGRDRNMIGLFRVEGGFSTLVSRLKLQDTEVERAFRELEAFGMALFDPGTEVFLVCEFFKHNPLTNMQMAVTAGHVLETVPDNALFREFAAMLEEIIQDQKKIETASKKHGDPTDEADNPSDWYGYLARKLQEKGRLDKRTPFFAASETSATGERTGKRTGALDIVKPSPEKAVEENRKRFWQAVETIKENRKCFWQAVEVLGLVPDDPFVIMAKEFTDKSSIAMGFASWRDQLQAFVRFGEDVGIDALQEMTTAFWGGSSGPEADHGIASFISRNKEQGMDNLGKNRGR